MSINLELSQSQLNDPKTNDIKLHYIPASIQGDGAANVDLFFNNYTAEENGVMRNTFRGHPLEGCRFTVPNTHKGLIFQETDTPLDENTNRVFKLAGSFDSFDYWNYDKAPSKADAFRQMWDVVSVAEAVSDLFRLDSIFY